jgi:Zn-dependent protease with chaperone function
MFAARGIAVSFSVFVMVYCVLSVVVSFIWRTVRRSQRQNVRDAADLLFALRMFPSAAAAAITVALAVPSFLLLEPRSINEPMGAIPLILGLCGALLAILGIVNASLAVFRASRIVSSWTIDAEPVRSCTPVPVLRISRALPAMTATGILRPKVLLSGAAELALTAGELRTALNHEIAHVRRRDNLKKLSLRLVTFPGLSGLEAKWLEATEIAADDAAVSNAGEGLDLASALIKLSRLGRDEAEADLTAALVHSPASVMNARVERLLAWSDHNSVRPAASPWYILTAALVAMGLFAVTYSQLLVHVHTATEWLVR